MRRFYFDDNGDEPEEEMDQYFDMDELEGAAAIIDITNLRLAERDQNQNLLRSVIKMLSKNWFWRFRSAESQAAMITKTYNAMLALFERKEKE